MLERISLLWVYGVAALVFFVADVGSAQTPPDFLRELHLKAVESKKSDWIHWGDRPGTFSNWRNHSNRLIPVYTFGIRLESVAGENSIYRDEKRLVELFGRLPTETLNPQAEYFDQTDIYRLQKQAFEAGKKNVILIVFDGMDWQTTQAAAIYKNRKVVYTEGRGTGLSFLDYGGGESDFGFFVTSPHHNDNKVDVDDQVVTVIGGEDRIGGYNAEFGGAHPWNPPGDPSYLLGRRKSLPHPVTDSASSATSMTSGFKTYNAAINIGPDGSQLETIAHQMQKKGLAIGVVTSVPISHATPACAYAHNVSRNDYQDLSRDLLGLKSVSHRESALLGVDVLIGCGWGEGSKSETRQARSKKAQPNKAESEKTETEKTEAENAEIEIAEIEIAASRQDKATQNEPEKVAPNADQRRKQGKNYAPGNMYLAEYDLKAIDIDRGGKYVIALRTADRKGADVLKKGVDRAIDTGHRLFGFFGVGGGHLPFRTADGNFDPTRGVAKGERYSKQDIAENPTLADMAVAALSVLKQNEQGFWLMIEAGDVDWANHNNNIDDSIGAVLSGEAAFEEVVRWVEKNSNWDETAVIVTSDHGHMLNVDDLEALVESRESIESPESRVQSRVVNGAENENLAEQKATLAP